MTVRSLLVQDNARQGNLRPIQLILRRLHSGAVTRSPWRDLRRRLCETPLVARPLEKALACCYRCCYTMITRDSLAVISRSPDESGENDTCNVSSTLSSLLSQLLFLLWFLLLSTCSAGPLAGTVVSCTRKGLLGINVLQCATQTH